MDEAEDDANLSSAFPIGWAKRVGGQLDFLVRTFDPTTGQLLWQDQFISLGRGDEALNDDTAERRRYL